MWKRLLLSVFLVVSMLLFSASDVMAVGNNKGLQQFIMTNASGTTGVATIASKAGQGECTFAVTVKGGAPYCGYNAITGENEHWSYLGSLMTDSSGNGYFTTTESIPYKGTFSIGVTLGTGAGWEPPYSYSCNIQYTVQ